jgi:hypothetical protein
MDPSAAVRLVVQPTRLATLVKKKMETMKTT